MNTLFFYGTLRHLPLLQLVLAREVFASDLCDAILKGCAVCAVPDADYPTIRPSKRQSTQGLLVRNLTPEDMRRLAFYEGGFHYDVQPHNVELPDGSLVQADVFFPRDDHGADRPWSFEQWQNDWSKVAMLAAQEVMGFYGRRSAEEIASGFSAIRTRAWARVAARERATGDRRKDVVLHQRDHAYLGYFALDEIQVQHRLNDGLMSPVLNRSSLMQGSAVVVLPYDPVRDVVLLVEQFRAPVYMIDDPEPWMWEPVAGMIDPGETPENAARREAQEEAQVDLRALHYAGGAYSSSGSSTEYIHLYVGLTDLTHTTDKGGLATEGEDIRTQILPFDDFMAAVDAHQFKDLPLLSLAHWLARHRDRLRA